MEQLQYTHYNTFNEEAKVFIRFIKEKHILEKILIKIKPHRYITNVGELIRYLEFYTQSKNSYLIDAVPTINEPFLFTNSKRQEYFKWLCIVNNYKTMLFNYRYRKYRIEDTTFNHEL